VQPLRLRELRDKNNLTQQEVADRLQLSSDAYSLYELGKRQMNYETLRLLAEIYNVSIDYLLGRQDTNLVQLSAEETELVNQYRLLDKRGKEAIRVNIAFEVSQNKTDIKTKKSAI
jgi:transcriptional regulator with XRE-family HTH domain